MSSELYRIVFSGEVTRGHAVADVKHALAKLFRVDTATVARLFGGRPVVLKQGVDAEEAIHFMSALSQAGAVSRMEPLPPGALKSNRVTFLERRGLQRRIRGERRKRPRHDAYVPDRRARKTRRTVEAGRKD